MHESEQVIAAGGAGLDFDRLSRPLGEHLDEGHEEIVGPVAELLHERVLVGRALVSVHRQSLVDDPTLQVVLLAQGLHHELLQVAREQVQPVLVGKYDHGLLPHASPGAVPGEGEHCGGVRARLRIASQDVHGRGAAQQLTDVDALKRGR